MRNFLHTTAEDEEAFDILYCIAFAMVDAQWLAMHASYMEFNVPLSLSLFVCVDVYVSTTLYAYINTQK